MSTPDAAAPLPEYYRSSPTREGWELFCKAKGVQGRLRPARSRGVEAGRDVAALESRPLARREAGPQVSPAAKRRRELPVCNNCCTPDELAACGEGRAVYRTSSRAGRCRRCTRPTVGRLAVLVALLVASCGGVTAVQLGPEADADGATVEAAAPVDVRTNGVDGGVMSSEAGTDAGAAPTSCASACAACSSTSARADAGPEYSSPTTCAAVVACVRADGGGSFPLQNCHNLSGGGAEFGGLFCVRDLLEAGCR